MTAYTPHADALFDPDKPILGSTQLEQRDNLIATAEGATGAPVVSIKARGKFTAGTTRRYYDASEDTQQGTGFGSAFASSIAGSGVVRVAFESKSTLGGTVRILVNGVTVSTWSLTTSYVARTADVTLAAGNYLVIEHSPQDSGGTQTSTVRFVELLTNGEEITPTANLTNWTIP